MAPLRHSEVRKGDEKHFGVETADLGGPAGLLIISPVTCSQFLNFYASQHPDLKQR